MTAQQMFESSLKEAQLLIKQKESLEEQIETQEQILRSQNVGMKTPLVDSEGFPRSDLDIYKIRNARSILAPLYNDLKGKMEEIHRAMEIVHSYSHEKSTMEVKPIELKVFAKINGVAPDSPAYNGGLLRGDLVLKFGVVDCNTKSGLVAIGTELAANEFKVLRVQVEREGKRVLLMVTPMPWNGKGLLGCHLVPL